MKHYSKLVYNIAKIWLIKKSHSDIKGFKIDTNRWWVGKERKAQRKMWQWAMDNRMWRNRLWTGGSGARDIARIWRDGLRIWLLPLSRIMMEWFTLLSCSVLFKWFFSKYGNVLNRNVCVFSFERVVFFRLFSFYFWSEMDLFDVLT